jgi:hypothetical protein
MADAHCSSWPPVSVHLPADGERGIVSAERRQPRRSSQGARKAASASARWTRTSRRGPRPRLSSRSAKRQVRAAVDSLGLQQLGEIIRSSERVPVTTSAAPASSPAANHIWPRIVRGSNAWPDLDNPRSGRIIEAATGSYLWAAWSDKPIANLFDMQDEIVARLANGLDLQLVAAEARRAEWAPNPDSMDLDFQG